MSDDYPDSVLEQLRIRLRDFAAQKYLHALLPAERMRLDAEVQAGRKTPEDADRFFALLEEVSRDPVELTDAELETIRFMEQLRNRQGTTPPDFESLYRQKAELDQKPHDRH